MLTSPIFYTALWALCVMSLVFICETWWHAVLVLAMSFLARLFSQLGMIMFLRQMSIQRVGELE